MEGSERFCCGASPILVATSVFGVAGKGKRKTGNRKAKVHGTCRSSNATRSLGEAEATASDAPRRLWRVLVKARGLGLVCHDHVSGHSATRPCNCSHRRVACGYPGRGRRKANWLDSCRRVWPHWWALPLSHVGYGRRERAETILVERGISKVRTLRNQTVRPSKAAAFYAAKYAAKQLGEIQFGGLLSGRNLHHLTSLPNGQRRWDDSLSSRSAGVATHSVIAPSAEVESFFYKRIGKSTRPNRKRRTRNIQKVSDESGQTVPQNRKLF